MIIKHSEITIVMLSSEISLNTKTTAAPSKTWLWLYIQWSNTKIAKLQNMYTIQKESTVL